jgi:hypothetical protein
MLIVAESMLFIAELVVAVAELVVAVVDLVMIVTEMVPVIAELALRVYYHDSCWFVGRHCFCSLHPGCVGLVGWSLSPSMHGLIERDTTVSLLLLSLLGFSPAGFLVSGLVRLVTSGCMVCDASYGFGWQGRVWFVEVCFLPCL